MRVYKDKKLTKVVCNNCGKNIKVNNSTIEEGVFFADYKWGYFSKNIGNNDYLRFHFSKKDGREDTFDLCEKCYDEITEKFLYKIKIKNYTELL